MADLIGVELAKVGTWDTSTGKWSPTAADFAAAVAAQAEPDVRAPVVKLGHTDPRFDGEPTLGTVRNLRVSDDGQTLIGDILGMPSWLAATVHERWPSRSVEGSLNAKTASGRTYAMVLDSVALLGITPPGVKGLADLPALIAASKLVGRLPAERKVAASMTRPRKISAAAAEAFGGISDEELAKIEPTGDDGEITLGDVRASYGLPRRPLKDEADRAEWFGLTVEQARAITAVKDRPPVASPVRLAASSHRYASTADPDLNPLVAAAQAAHPQRVAAAAAAGAPEPTLFNSGDLPPFCASGIDPQILRQVPWQGRHALARAETTQDAYALLSDFSGPDGDQIARGYEGDEGNQLYAKRVADWVEAGVSEAEREEAWQASPMGQMTACGEAEIARQEAQVAAARAQRLSTPGAAFPQLNTE